MNQGQGHSSVSKWDEPFIVKQNTMKSHEIWEAPRTQPNNGHRNSEFSH